jgi:hypothetical protein
MEAAASGHGFDARGHVVKKQQIPCELLIDPLLQSVITDKLLSEAGLIAPLQASWRLIVTTSLIQGELAWLDRALQPGAQPFCPVEIGASGALRLGPLYTADRKICFDCAFSRLTRSGYQPLRLSDPAIALARLPSLLEETDRLQTSIAEISADSPGIRWHALWPDQGCPRCRPRAASPPLTDLVSPISGAIRQVEISPLTDGLYVAEGECSPAVMGSFRGGVRRARRIRVQGAGLSPEEAWARCVGEAIERTSLILDPGDSIEWATYRDIAPRALDPRELLLGQAPFDPDQNRPWTTAITPEGESCLVPAECCFFGYDSWPPGADSSGCAAGPTVEFARQRALRESIERDAVSIWWRRQAILPRVDPAGFSQPEFAIVGSFLARTGRDWWLLDASTGLGSVAVAVSPGPDGSGIALGSGAGATVEQAAARALMELAVTIHAPPDHPGALAWRDVRIGDAPHLQPGGLGELAADLSVENETKIFLKIHTKSYWTWPVVRVLAPGWCSFDRYQGSPRLSEVPRVRGWRCLTEPDRPDSRPWPA